MATISHAQSDQAPVSRAAIPGTTKIPEPIVPPTPRLTSQKAQEIDGRKRFLPWCGSLSGLQYRACARDYRFIQGMGYISIACRFGCIIHNI